MVLVGETISSFDFALAPARAAGTGAGTGPQHCASISQSRGLSISEKHPYRVIRKTPESGVGDDAYSVAGGGVVTLSVKKGAAFIIIFVQVPNASPEQTKALERKVALKLVEKL